MDRFALAVQAQQRKLSLCIWTLTKIGGDGCHVQQFEFYSQHDLVVLCIYTLGSLTDQ